MRSFSSFLNTPKDHTPNDEDQEHIDRFHDLHHELERAGHHLHKKGYFVDIDYASNHAARHTDKGKHKGSTLSFNQALLSKKKIRISKSALRDDEK